MWFGTSWKKRIPVAVDNSAGTTTNKDFTLVLPPDWDDFWGSVRTDGFDLRVTGPNGLTPLTFKRTSWNHTGRSGTLDVQGLPVTASTMAQAWLYWGNASATDGAGSFAPSSPLTSWVTLDVPTSRIVRVLPERPDDLKPRALLGKMSSEETYVLWDFRPVLHRRATAHNGQVSGEEVDRVAVADVRLNDAAQASMTVFNKAQMFDGLVATLLKGGQSGTTYTALCRVVTTDGRVVEGRARVAVRDPKE